MSLCPCRPRTMATPKLPTIRVTTSVAAIHRQRRPGLGGGAGTMGAAWPSGGMGDGPCSPPPKRRRWVGGFKCSVRWWPAPLPFPGRLPVCMARRRVRQRPPGHEMIVGHRFMVLGAEREERAAHLHSTPTPLFFVGPFFFNAEPYGAFLLLLGCSTQGNLSSRPPARQATIYKYNTAVSTLLPQGCSEIEASHNTPLTPSFLPPPKAAQHRTRPFHISFHFLLLFFWVFPCCGCGCWYVTRAFIPSRLSPLYTPVAITTALPPLLPLDSSTPPPPPPPSSGPPGNRA